MRPPRLVMITALGTLVFIHKRQRLRRHQALRDYYFEQMELSLVYVALAVSFAVTDAGYLPCPIFSIASVGQLPHSTTRPRLVN